MNLKRLKGYWMSKGRVSEISSLVKLFAICLIINIVRIKGFCWDGVVMKIVVFLWTKYQYRASNFPIRTFLEECESFVYLRVAWFLPKNNQEGMEKSWIVF